MSRITRIAMHNLDTVKKTTKMQRRRIYLWKKVFERSQHRSGECHPKT